MKQFLLVLSTISALLSATTSLTNVSQTNIAVNLDNYIENLKQQLKGSWAWKNVQINHSVNTPASGTHERENLMLDIYAVANVSWGDFFVKSQQLIANGYFALHTYRNPSYFNNLILNFDSSNSKSNFRTWVAEASNDQWSGWAHQTSKIKLTVIAKYDSETELTALVIQSYIYARTAGSVHECSTTSQIKTIKFVV